MIPTLTLCSLDYLRGMVDVYIYIIRAVNILTFIYLFFTGKLRDMGFKLHPYDKCVANNMIDGKQCTIAWWVDDNCLTHLSAKVLDRIIERIKLKLGKMAVTRGETHTFLGINLSFPGDGTVRLTLSFDFCASNQVKSSFSVVRTLPSAL